MEQMVLLDTTKPKRKRRELLCYGIILASAVFVLIALAMIINLKIKQSTSVSPVFPSPNDIQVDVKECGKVHLYREAMLGGTEVVKDEWPFIAALYYTRTLKYFCGGTIISPKHILTAAHCIQTKFKLAKLSPDEITVRLGAYNLADRSETDAFNRSVTAIHIHPDWKFNEEKYDADIAILVLTDSVSFSDHIRPVCMPPENYLMDELLGTVVGWGKTENGTAEGIPRKIEVNALSDTRCYNTDEGITSYASERSFCGEGSGTPNVGDSGGGFFAVDGSGWVQFGTVSFVRPEATGSTLKVALYMKLSSLRQWIADKVGETGDTISLATTKENLNCTYGYTSSAVYGCWLHDLNIRQESFVVKKFLGSHVTGKGDDDVEMISFNSGVMALLPRNFGNIFKNLKFLEISVDTKHISRSNLHSLEFLEMIQFIDSKVEELDEDSLWDLPNLLSFKLEKSEVKLLHLGTLSRNSKLKSLPRNLFRKNLLLDTVSFDDNLIETVDDSIFEMNSNLRVVSLKGNQLSHLSKSLFQNNQNLQFLDLSDNDIKTIEEHAFKTNFKLLSLKLESNELEFLPAHLLQGMAFLKEFHLEKNQLQTIDERFFETNANIEEIYLQSNQLNRIPANFFRSNSQLKIVNLDDNSIETIDENLFEENVLLRNVSLESNGLSELPHNLFKRNTMLEFVFFRSNSLETVDERTFQWNPKLREVYLSDNYVSTLPTKLFENNPLLETVHFSRNHLEAIDDHTFQANAKLRDIHLMSNLLTYIPENLFRHNPSLEMVDLSNNFFGTLSENVFSRNPNLMFVRLQMSQFQVLPQNLFHSNPHLLRIDLAMSSFQVIKTDFTQLKHVNYIDLSGNNCIDTVFHNVKSDPSDQSNERRWPRWTNNLSKFQDLVTAKCSQK
ncbi:hypothetical protein HA402_013839 [Bradysia odoriphaga]|nr:hypothetical protein HA402_013839 [Bradysia odoriphaga]